MFTYYLWRWSTVSSLFWGSGRADELLLLSLSLISHLASVDVKQHVYLLFLLYWPQGHWPLDQGDSDTSALIVKRHSFLLPYGNVCHPRHLTAPRFLCQRVLALLSLYTGIGPVCSQSPVSSVVSHAILPNCTAWSPSRFSHRTCVCFVVCSFHRRPLSHGCHHREASPILISWLTVGKQLTLLCFSMAPYRVNKTARGGENALKVKTQLQHREVAISATREQQRETKTLVTTTVQIVFRRV